MDTPHTKLSEDRVKDAIKEMGKDQFTAEQLAEQLGIEAHTMGPRLLAWQELGWIEPEGDKFVAGTPRFTTEEERAADREARERAAAGSE